MDVDEINKEIFALQLKSAAMTYHKVFSMNISPIEGSVDNSDVKAFEKSYKNPIECVLDDYDWKAATGIGVNLGDNVWALDIDNIPTVPDKREKLLSDILYILRLPEDYEWVSNSGGGKGLHILFRTQFLHEEDFENAVLNFSSDEVEMTVSLRMKAFLVLPPSKHFSGGQYEFITRRMPKNKPHFISADSLYAFFSKYFGHRDIVTLEDEPRVYLKRHGILKKWDWDSYGNYHVYYFNDSLVFLKSCHSPEALNSLGCLYAQLAYKNPAKKDYFFELAKSCFEESDNGDAKNNLDAIFAIQKSLKGGSDCPRRDFGEYCYVYLKKRGYKYLFFDTETTGLPKRFDASYKDFDDWPRLVQISWLCVSEDGFIISEQNRYIKPVGFTIPEEASRIHGVTTPNAINFGKDIEEVLYDFADCANYADYIIGHNVDYDKNVVCSEIQRNMNSFDGHTWICDYHDHEEIDPLKLLEREVYYFTYDEIIARCPTIDTMKLSVNICKIPGYNGQYKYPKLQELYRFLFGKEFGNVHNSMADIRATLECFLELKQRGIIQDS